MSLQDLSNNPDRESRDEHAAGPPEVAPGKEIAMPTTKEEWGRARWRDLAARYAEFHRRLVAAIAAFPRTRGDVCRRVDACVAAWNETAYTAVLVQDAFWGRFPDDPPLFPDRVASRDVPPRPVVPIIPPERWVALGREWTWLRAEAFALETAIRSIRPVATRPRQRIARVVRAIDKARCALDSLVCRQYPDWEGAIRVFSGDADPDPAAAGRPALGLPAPRGDASVIRLAEAEAGVPSQSRNGGPRPPAPARPA